MHDLPPNPAPVPATTTHTAASAIHRRDFMVRSAGLVAAAAITPSLSAALGRLAAPVRVGVIGCGRQGRAIISELGTIDGAQLTALCDIEPRRLDAGARRSADAKTFTDHRALLDAKVVDAVFIATPTHLHRGVVEDALAAGLHVYCEAPLAHTVEDARAIAAAARGAKTLFQAGYLARANPVYQLARTFFRSDAVRDLVSMSAVRARKTSWAVPASDAAAAARLNWRLDPEITTGLAGEWGSHQFDVFHWYTDRYPVAVSGIGSTRLHTDDAQRGIHDTIACHLLFPDNVVLSYQATLANSYEGQHELLRGTNAAIKLAWSHGWMFKEADAPTQGWEVYANRQQFHKDEGITLIAGATKLAEQGKLQQGVGLPHESLWYGVESFLRSITDSQPAVCSADDAMRSTVVGIRTHEALATASTVRINPADLA